MNANIYYQTLQRALAAAGGLTSLAAHLLLPEQQVQSWLDGGERVPAHVFLQLVDFLEGRQTNSFAVENHARKVAHMHADQALRAALLLHGTDMGNVQVLNRDGQLEIIEHRGFNAEFLKFFQTVTADEGCACGVALREGKRIVAADIKTDAIFDATPEARKALLKAGAASVQSTPIQTRHGKTVGVISTHFRNPLDSPDSLLPLDRIAFELSFTLERLCD